jgi:hypothetical protein
MTIPHPREDQFYSVELGADETYSTSEAVISSPSRPRLSPVTISSALSHKTLFVRLRHDRLAMGQKERAKFLGWAMLLPVRQGRALDLVAGAERGPGY